MNWDLFWSAFGAIGGTIGALATAGAVIVALWQTKFTQKKKLKLFLNEDITIMTQDSGKCYRYVGITVTNIGNREIIINSWGINMHDGGRIVILKNTSPIDKLIQVDLPHKLAIEESVDLSYSKKNFFDFLCENIENKKIQINRKLEFYVKDSTGEIYLVKTSQKVEEIMEKLKQQIK